MARKALVDKQQERIKKAKFSTRKYNRCTLCGRPRAYFRDFGVCRICLKHLVAEGKLPGMRKASW